jgi:hypothetical protein
VRPVRPDPQGLSGPTRRQAARAGDPTSGWRRVWRGWYVPSYVDPDLPEQRVIEASALLPSGGAVTGWAALRLHGATFFDGRDRQGGLAPVELVTPHFRPDLPGVTWRQDLLDASDVVVRAGIPVTRPERAVFDAMRRAPDDRSAVRHVDMACAAELVSLRRVAKYAESRSGWVGMPRVEVGLELGSEHSRSPLETDGRLVWELDAGLPRPRVNVPVFSRRGKLLGIADLLDEDAGLVIELDGADHAGALRRSKDSGREGGLRNHRLEVERVTGYDLHHRAGLVRRLHDARGRALWLPPDARPWTVEPPAWWEPDLPLDVRLDLRDLERAGDEAAG